MTGSGNHRRGTGDGREGAVQRGAVAGAARARAQGHRQAGRSAEDGGDVTAMHRQITGRLVIATHNPGKLVEMRELLAPYGVEAVSAAELNLPEPEETGTTFAANARIKAEAAAQASGLAGFADDSGLVVDALGGAPGIYSARWAGETKDFKHAMEKSRPACASATPSRRSSATRTSSRRCASPGRTATSRNSRARVDGTLVWPPRGEQGLRLRPDVSARRPRPHLRRDDRRGEARTAAAGARPVASRARIPQARGGVPWQAIASGPRRLRRLRPLAVLPVEVPLLRLQQPCAPRGDRRSALRARVRGRDRRDRARAPGRAPSSTIFFGGGTPSLMQPATVGAILDAIGKHWTVAPDVEVTLEANPTSVEATRFRGYRAAGVNRVSLGVQALDDASLKELGRLHTAQEALDAVADRAHDLRALLVRPDLRAAGPDAAGVARRASRARSAKPPSISRSISSPSSPDTPFAALHAAGKLVIAGRRHRARALRHDAGNLRGARASGLRDFQSRARRRGVPAQSRLLARPRICRHRPGRARPPRHRRRAPRDRRPRSARKRWLMRVEASGHGVITDETLTRASRPTNIC